MLRLRSSRRRNLQLKIIACIIVVALHLLTGTRIACEKGSPSCDHAWYDRYFKYLEQLFGLSVPEENGHDDLGCLEETFSTSTNSDANQDDRGGGGYGDIDRGSGASASSSRGIVYDSGFGLGNSGNAFNYTEEVSKLLNSSLDLVSAADDLSLLKQTDPASGTLTSDSMNGRGFGVPPSSSSQEAEEGKILVAGEASIGVDSTSNPSAHISEESLDPFSLASPSGSGSGSGPGYDSVPGSTVTSEFDLESRDFVTETGSHEYSLNSKNDNVNDTNSGDGGGDPDNSVGGGGGQSTMFVAISPTLNHPLIQVRNVTELTCWEYVILEFWLDAKVFDVLPSEISNYDVNLLDGKSCVQKLNILPPFPLPQSPTLRKKNDPFRLTFYPWNDERHDVLGGTFLVQVRLLNDSFEPLTDPTRKIPFASCSSPFTIPTC